MTEAAIGDSAELALVPKLHHYTNIDGLFGILESGALWGTHIAYLNDFQELDFGIDALCTLLEEAESDWSSGSAKSGVTNPWTAAGEGKILADLVRLVRQGIYGNKTILKQEFGPFVSCLSASRDQLSQWRGYANGGYAICFNTNGLNTSARVLDHEGKRPSMKVPGPQLERITYVAQDEAVPFHGEVVEAVIDYIHTTFPEKIRRALQENVPPLIADGNGLDPYGMADIVIGELSEYAFESDLTGRILALASRIKHCKFEEENEWRLVCSNRETFYSTSKIGLIPRISLGFNTKAVEEVVVGPGPHTDVQAASIERYLYRNRRRYPNACVARSEIPYRDF